jgi:hypothetical protein
MWLIKSSNLVFLKENSLKYDSSPTLKTSLPKRWNDCLSQAAPFP